MTVQALARRKITYHLAEVGHVRARVALGFLTNAHNISLRQVVVLIPQKIVDDLLASRIVGQRDINTFDETTSCRIVQLLRSGERRRGILQVNGTAGLFVAPTISNLASLVVPAPSCQHIKSILQQALYQLD